MLSDQQKNTISEIKSRFQIKNLKTFSGLEGLGVSAVLYENGKKVSNIIDDANGGSLRICDVRFEDKLNVELDMKVGKFIDESFGKPIELSYDAEILINELINASLFDKDIKPKCKTKTLFVTKNCEENSYIMISSPYTEQIREYLKTKYGSDLVEILNERYIK